MQQTFQLNTENLNSTFLDTIKSMFGKKDITIVVEEVQPDDDQEKLFMSLFGSWQGEETGEELVKQIYGARINSSHDTAL